MVGKTATDQMHIKDRQLTDGCKKPQLRTTQFACLGSIDSFLRLAACVMSSTDVITGGSCRPLCPSDLGPSCWKRHRRPRNQAATVTESRLQKALRGPSRRCATISDSSRNARRHTSVDVFMTRAHWLLTSSNSSSLAAILVDDHFAVNM